MAAGKFDTAISLSEEGILYNPEQKSYHHIIVPFSYLCLGKKETALQMFQTWKNDPIAPGVDSRYREVYVQVAAWLRAEGLVPEPYDADLQEVSSLLSAP